MLCPFDGLSFGQGIRSRRASMTQTAIVGDYFGYRDPGIASPAPWK
jgi:hypothetical protein